MDVHNVSAHNMVISPRYERWIQLSMIDDPSNRTAKRIQKCLTARRDSDVLFRDRADRPPRSARIKSEECNDDVVVVVVVVVVVIVVVFQRARARSGSPRSKSKRYLLLQRLQRSQL